MKVRYFTKRGSVWIDFRLPDGTRKRMPTGVAEGQQKAAEKAAAGIMATAFAESLNTQAVPSAKQTAPVGCGVTVQQAFDLAMKVREQWIKSKVPGTLKQTLKSILDNGHGLTADSDVTMLTRPFVRELRTLWLQEPGKRKGSTLSASTVNHRLSLLSVLLEVADQQSHGVKHLSTKGNRRMRRISDEEVQRMVAWCRAHASRRGADTMGDLIRVALATGARQGELLGLTWSDVTDDTMTFRDTKNSDSRVIPMNDEAASILRSRRSNPAPFHDLDADRITVLWNDMRFAMGLASDDEFVFHALRHEALSRLADRDVSAFTIAAIAGHANITTTQVYVKTSIGAMRRALGMDEARAAVRAS